MDLLHSIFGLRTLRPGDEGVNLGFTFELRAYEWALAIALCVLAAWWCYRRLDGPRWGRATLATLRALLLALLVLLVTGPKLVRPNETIEKDWLVVLLDRSASMNIADATTPDGQKESRDQQLRQALVKNKAALEAASKDRSVLVMGFDAGAFEIKPGATGVVDAVALGNPVGGRSDLSGALEQALAKIASRPLSGVLVLSDGRVSGGRTQGAASTGASRSLLRKLAAEKTPIITVALGSPDPVGDVSVRSVQGPGVAFANDVVPIEAAVEFVGAGGAAGRAKVQLVDTATGRVLDEQAIEWEAQPIPAPGTARAERPVKRATLTSTPTDQGSAKWAVRVVPDGPDLLAGNNESPVSVDVVDRPLRVVYFDGYPRWEYRYLQAILTREKSIASSAQLLSGGRRFIQEGNTLLPALPTSPAEWAAIDVIILGDVRPEVFSGEQLRQLRERVAVGGAGLLFIGGESAMPSAWRSTPIGDLLPISTSGDYSPGDNQRTYGRDLTMRPTPLADRLGVLRLLRTPELNSWWPPSVSDPESGWSRLRWAQRIDPSSLKPAAEALAFGSPVGDAAAGDEGVLVATMRFGAGRIVYVATDEIWRWRYGRGEDLPERFYLQLVRLLGRDSVARAGRRALLTASPIRGEVGRPIRLNLELIDQTLADAAAATVNVRVERVGEVGAKPNDPSTLPTDRDADSAAVTLRSAGQPKRTGVESRPTLAGTFIAARAGLYRASVADPLLAGSTDAAVTTEFEVTLPDDELRQPETDHPLLANLSKETGGAAMSLSDWSALPGLLPKREVHIALAPDEESLWDKPIMLILVLLLATAEWIGRRLLRLT